MAVLKAFRGVRPAPEAAASVAAVPYDVVDRWQARAIGEKNPDSFLHVDRAEMDLPPDTDIYSPQVYEKAKENLNRMIKDGILIEDPAPCYYLYELTRKGKVQTGVVGCASIDEYQKGIVKKHELTREDKEQDRICHVDECDANTGPIFLAADFPRELKDWIASWKTLHPPIYDFTSEDGIRHRCWKAGEAPDVETLRAAIRRIPSFYIADGHHRAASAVKVGLKRRREHPGYDGTEEFNYFLSVVFPYEELTILPYNRVVLGRNGMDKDTFLARLREKFTCRAWEGEGIPRIPGERHSFFMYVGGKWYGLRADPALYEGKDVVEGLDVSILQKEVLAPLLGIDDPRTDSRIRFEGGSKDVRELMDLADKGDGTVFLLYPTSMDELMRIADAGRLMPPKSTWFEPKLRSGLFIHKLS